METIQAAASKNTGDIIKSAISVSASAKVLVVFDEKSALSKIVTDGYRTALPDGIFLDFYESGAEGFFSAIDKLKSGDVVVLVQSSSFRLDAFRIRIELFKRGLGAVEHLHLERAKDEREYRTYVDSLAYDPAYYRGLGSALKRRIDAAKRIVVRGRGTELVYEGGMEPAKLNVGDYRGMKNVGGTFPIGEVFSEPRDLALVNGEARIFAFAGTDHMMRLYEPFKIRIEKGVVTAPEAPPEFHADVLDRIMAEEEVLVREFGLGLNPAMGPKNIVNDVTAFERQKGLHLSLGEKHGIYKKPGFNPKKTHFHIDIFVAADEIEIDGEIIWRDGDFNVEKDSIS